MPTEIHVGFACCKKKFCLKLEHHENVVTSSLSIEDRNDIMTLCFRGNFMHRDLQIRDNRIHLFAHTDKVSFTIVILLMDCSPKNLQNLTEFS